MLLDYRKFFLILTILMTGLVVGAYASTTAPSDPYFLGEDWGVNSNPHNLSRQSNNPLKATDVSDPNATRICVFCHVPHSAEVDTPLWGRPDPVLMGSFTIYNSAASKLSYNSTVNALADYGGADYPNGASKLCLSCHDGATAVGTLIGDRLIIAMSSDTIYNSAMIIDDTGLGNSHPISFVYNASVVTALNNAYLPSGPYYLYNSPYLDKDQRMQCTTCHDPHYNSDLTDGARRSPYGTGGTYDLPFWRGTRAGVGNENDDYSKLCGGCHTGGSGPTAGPPNDEGHDI